MKKLLLAATGITLMMASCSRPATETKKEVAPKDPLLENMDTTVNPSDDFFLYSCGGWIKKNPIPGNEKSFGIWSLVMNETYTRMKKISEEAANSNGAAGSAEQKIGDFYTAGMDTVNIDKMGITPLNGEISKINGINNQASLLSVLAAMHTYGVNPLFSSYVMQDEKNSEKQMLHLYQGGIGLPDRDYYFNTDSRTINIRAEYSLHVRNMFMLMGEDSATATKNSTKVLAIETTLAKSSRKLEDLRDPYRNYKKVTVAEMKDITPSIDWSSMFQAMHLGNVDSVIVGQPEFYKEVDKSLRKVSLEDWKVYLRWNLVNTFATYLSKPFEKEHFNFFSTVMNGVKVQRARYKRVLDEEEQAMGDMLGQLYVKKFVSPAVKKRYQDLTNNIIQAYRERIHDLTWMSDSTKAKALVKLNSITTKVAYPDKWKDYTALNINRSSFVMNVLNANVWSHDYMASKLGKPVDRTEWDMTPQTYNAYYNPSNNEIVLPAAIFIIPGMEDTLADDAIIYGYAGASTIGHEITHGFDDQGRQFDEKGNLKNWWTANDEKEFSKRSDLIVRQFNAFKVLDSLHVNGSATQGENIADLGGVVLGYQAFKKTEQYKSGKKINGLTPDQRYFLGYALSWVGKMRDETLANRLMTDVHAPNFLRINGPMANIPEFYKAFGIKEGSAMHQSDSLRVNIW